MLLHKNNLLATDQRLFTGTASVARAWSSYIDSLAGHKISDFFKAHIHINSGGTFSDYPDFFALSITLLLTGV